MRPRTKTGIQLALTVVILAGFAEAFPKSQTAYGTGLWYVASGGSDSSDCLSSTTPCASIDGAIEKAKLGDMILVATGIYTGSSGSAVSVNKSLILSGGWNSEFIKQDGMSTVDGEGMQQGVN